MALLDRIESLCRENVQLYALGRKLSFWMYYLLRFPHIPQFSILKHVSPGGRVLLDIGANDGISALAIRAFNQANPILSIEANSSNTSSLSFLKRRLDGFDFLISGVGREAGSMVLYVPSYKGRPLLSFASLDKTEALEISRQGMFTRSFDQSSMTCEALPVDIVTVDSLGLDPAFVKIDVQGWELNVLEGMRMTLVRSRPLLLLECEPKTRDAILSLLDELDYQAVDHETLTPVTPESGSNIVNLTFAPKSLLSGN